MLRFYGRTDGRKDGRTDGRTDRCKPVYPTLTLFQSRGIISHKMYIPTGVFEYQGALGDDVINNEMNSKEFHQPI